MPPIRLEVSDGTSSARKLRKVAAYAAARQINADVGVSPGQGDGEQKRDKSRLLGCVHMTTAGLQKTGLIDKAAMCAFDPLCPTPVQPLTPEDIRAGR